MNSPRHLLSALLLCGLLLLIPNASAQAGSATWNLNPTSGDWNTATNWTPNTVPNGLDDIATFGFSNQTAITVSTFGTEVNELIFNPAASAFTISSGPNFTISGIGITNNSGLAQNFVVTSFNSLSLANGAIAGNMTFFSLANGCSMQFRDTASADHGTFVIDGSDIMFGSGGSLIFADNSTAGNGSFTASGSSFRGGSGTGGGVDFQGGTAGDGVFVANGGTADRALGGEVLFAGGTAGNATLIANPGTNGGEGGEIRFAFALHADHSNARIELFGNGTLDMTYTYFGEETIGSIEGDGVVKVNNPLNTGANNLSTTFSGTIQEVGSLTKIGTGSFTLTGANTYTGGTAVEGGELVVNNREGSGTGSGIVRVTGGRLAGRGTIAGIVTVGTGGGPGAALGPGRRGGKPDSLTIERALSFNSDATYNCGLNTKSAKADQVVANDVTINNAQFSLLSRGGLTLTPGTVLTVINNTAATPIAGTFANLPDGSMFTTHGNTFQANYEGGDGNDLTLTVVP
jgi:autotransporter-associated beta strand protein